jgi:hypothetical protein
MISLLQDDLYSPCQFGSVKDWYFNCQRCVSGSGQQLYAAPFVDLVKRIETFPATECVCQLRNRVRDFGTKHLIPSLSISWQSKQESYCLTLRIPKSALRFSGKCRQIQELSKQVPNARALRGIEGGAAWSENTNIRIECFIKRRLGGIERVEGSWRRCCMVRKRKYCIWKVF